MKEKNKANLILKKSLILILVLIFLSFPHLESFAQATPTPTPVEKGLSITIEVPGPSPSPTPTVTPTPTPSPTPTVPPVGGGGVVIPAPLPTQVIFKGRAYPLAVVTILKAGVVAGTVQATNSGDFEKSLTGLSGGMYSFGFWAEDNEGRKSVTISFTINILEGTTTTVEGIFISPTISLSPTQVERGNNVNVAGQVYPNSEINLFIASQETVKEVPASEEGKWDYKLDTSPLSEGEHSARAKAVFGEGEQSPFSQTLPFLVLKRGALVCKGADLNFDGRVNLIDFSILMYWWEERNPQNICADINQDGIVNIVDFSIMMYWWSG